jgi:hypothetical protein
VRNATQLTQQGLFFKNPLSYIKYSKQTGFCKPLLRRRIDHKQKNDEKQILFIALLNEAKERPDGLSLAAFRPDPGRGGRCPGKHIQMHIGFAFSTKRFRNSPAVIAPA